MPKFKKKENELKSKFDKWLYVIKNLDKPLQVVIIPLFNQPKGGGLISLQSQFFEF